MKIKTLLVASFAIFALAATADPYIPVSNKVKVDMTPIKATEIGGTTAFMTVTYDRTGDGSEDFTNLQMTYILPEGLEGGSVSASTDTEVWNEDEEANVQVLAWSRSWLADLKEFRMVGANITKTPITKTPLVLCRLKMKKTAEPAEGSKIELRDFKYTDYANHTYMWVEEGGDPTVLEGHKYVLTFTDESGQEIEGIPGYTKGSGVDNINAGKVVAGVKYINVAGVASDEAFEGVNIVVTNYVDGTQSVTKVVK